jgi:hypothetical protein
LRGPSWNGREAGGGVLEGVHVAQIRHQGAAAELLPAVGLEGIDPGLMDYSLIPNGVTDSHLRA